jgi:thioredoxin reductase (NADPH)
MVVDDQADDLETTGRELQKRYGADYEIVCEPSPEAALQRLEGLVLKDGVSGETSTVSAAALFVLIGVQPHTEWLPASVTRDERGFILTGQDLVHDGKKPEGWPLQRDPFLLETSLPGVFAIGDVRLGSLKRVASAVGDGSTAIQFVHQYFLEHQKVI